MASAKRFICATPMTTASNFIGTGRRHNGRASRMARSRCLRTGSISTTCCGSGWHDPQDNEAHWPVTSLRDFCRIVEKTLAEYLVAAPLLQAHLVKPAHRAGFFGQFEDPVDGDAIAFDHR